jgi:hypothetical protein
MPKQTNSNGGGIWVVVGLVFAIALLGSLFGNPNNRATSNAVDHNSSEYRYAQERMRLEGYSDADSKTAAEAVVKFHNAQKNRNR